MLSNLRLTHCDYCQKNPFIHFPLGCCFDSQLKPRPQVCWGCPSRTDWLFHRSLILAHSQYLRSDNCLRLLLVGFGLQPLNPLNVLMWVSFCHSGFLSSERSVCLFFTPSHKGGKTPPNVTKQHQGENILPEKNNCGGCKSVYCLAWVIFLGLKMSNAVKINFNPVY